MSFEIVEHRGEEVFDRTWFPDDCLGGNRRRVVRLSDCALTLRGDFR
jgi:hypothetical protein